MLLFFVVLCCLMLLCPIRFCLLLFLILVEIEIAPRGGRNRSLVRCFYRAMPSGELFLSLFAISFPFFFHCKFYYNL